MTIVQSARRFIAGSAMIVTAVGGIATAAVEQRPLTVEDVLRLEQLPLRAETQSAFSPDGQAVVFAMVRSQQEDPVGWTGFYPAARHSDLLFQPAAGRPALQITHGETDSSGWFDPQWSPSGRRLLMKSTRGGDLRYWVWERETGSLKLAADNSVEGFPDLWRCHSAKWLDDTHILFCALPQGVRSQLIFPDVERLAKVGWAKAEGGVESSGSIISSGTPKTTLIPSDAQLLSLDIETGKSRVLVDGGVLGFTVSQNGKYVAVLRKEGVRRVVGIPPQERWGEKDQLVVINLDGRRLVASPSTVSVPWLGGWSPSGEEIAFWGLDQVPGRENAPPTLYRAKPRAKGIEAVNTGLLDGNERIVPEWTAAGNLVVSAGLAVNSDTRAAAGARADWYLVKSNSLPRNLTGNFANSPPTLEPSSDNRSFTAAADGKLWTIAPDSNGLERLTVTFAPMVKGVGKAYSESEMRNADILVQAREGAQGGWYVLQGASRLPYRLAAPTAEAKLVSYSTRGGSALFIENSSHGTFIWRTQREAASPELLKSSNLWIRDIEQGQAKRLTYTSLDGEKLFAWMILPVGYQSGRRYPMVTWVYAGSMAKEDGSGLSLTDGYYGSIFQIFASKGYAVLVPSMPRKVKIQVHMSEPDDELLGLTNGVLPAVDAAVASNVADPDRLFVGGHSFGGYSTYGLVTQTTRFKAAVAMAGFTDLVSFWGAVHTEARYSDSFESMLNMSAVEAAQPAMIKPPWNDLGRYIRNSPITYVERVQTPTLMIHGDIDQVPLSQAEEFFAALYRQGKPAELVRYWGEGHIIASPANYRDMWTRMLSWFDEYGDIQRDDRGNMIFDGGRVKSRDGTTALEPEDYARFDKLASQPGAMAH